MSEPESTKVQGRKSDLTDPWHFIYLCSLKSVVWDRQEVPPALRRRARRLIIAENKRRGFNAMLDGDT